MNIVDSTKNAFKTFVNSLSKPESFAIGEMFEELVRDIYFIKDYYNLINKTHNFDQNSKDFVESSLNPDYEFSIVDTDFRFYVECKFRDITNNIDCIYKINEDIETSSLDLYSKNKEIDKQTKKYRFVEICNEAQFKRFKELNKTQKVFIILFLFDSNEEMWKLHLIPIQDLIVNYVDIDSIDYYIFPNDFYIVPGKLIDLVRVGTEAYCIRCKNIINKSLRLPLCNSCWEIWIKYKNFRFKEKYCHFCGKELDVSVSKPICLDCYRNIGHIKL